MDRIRELADELAELNPSYLLYAAPSRYEASSGIGLSGDVAEWRRVLSGLVTRAENRMERIHALKSVVADLCNVVNILLSVTHSTLDEYATACESIDRASSALRNTLTGESA
ncbi:MAG TPA: hypothetical protein VM529_13555 [Gemmata sp.]|jgi:hypothetical protein|nr:hypothetical protein [Gemmata sp.]